MSSPISKDSRSKEAQPKDKKRRRPLKNESALDNASKKTRTMAEKSSPSGKDQRTAFFQEENNIDKRDAATDLKLHAAACDELRNIMTQIRAIKVKGNLKQSEISKLEDLRTQGCLQFITLKRLNRFSHFRCKKAKDKTSDAKLQIDQHHLKLQNLLYEVMHLQKEITKCLEFKSKDEEINLITEDDFYNEAPENISKPEVTKEDPHQKTLARLDWELEQRKQLSNKLKETQSKKDDIAKEINSKKDYLDSLQPMLNNILQSTKPAQDHLMMPFDETREQYKNSAYLPRPLYVLYVQVSAFMDAVDKQLSVTIQGDIDVARALDGSSVDLEEDSDSDQEQEEKPREKRRRRNTNKDRATQRRQRMLRKHPLSVHVTVKCKDGSTLFLTFAYLMALEIVTVSVKLTPATTSVYTSISGGDLLSPDTLLSCLYPEDIGDDTPNPANRFALQRLGLKEFSSYVQEVGRPYQWVQKLCGLQFLGNIESKNVKEKDQAAISASHMEDTFVRLRQRVQARLSMQKQLVSLEKCSILVSPDFAGMFHAKTSSRLSQWKRSTYEDYLACPYTQSIVDAGLAGENDLIYTGTMTRGSAQLQLQVAVSQDYPSTAPIFSLSLQWNSEADRSSNENIRDMEAEVNIYYTELINEKDDHELLSNQLQRLLMCFDVYLETQCDGAGTEGPVEFAKEKIFPRATRGPSRSRPFIYDSKHGLFLQR